MAKNQTKAFSFCWQFDPVIGYVARKHLLYVVSAAAVCVFYGANGGAIVWTKYFRHLSEYI